MAFGNHKIYRVAFQPRYHLLDSKHIFFQKSDDQLNRISYGACLRLDDFFMNILLLILLDQYVSHAMLGLRFKILSLKVMGRTPLFLECLRGMSLAKNYSIGDHAKA